MLPDVSEISSGNIAQQHKSKQATSHPPEGMEGWKGGKVEHVFYLK